MSLQIREEQPADVPWIRQVNEAAFGRAGEADLIDRLRDGGDIVLSLVAELEGQVIGHILFSRMSIETAAESVAAISLAPMAVLPEHQRQRVGSELVRCGLARLRDSAGRIVIVLGHKEYYPRFGFSAEKTADLHSPFPPEAFMALELVEGALAGVRGSVRYSSAFQL